MNVFYIDFLYLYKNGTHLIKLSTTITTKKTPAEEVCFFGVNLWCKNKISNSDTLTNKFTVNAKKTTTTRKKMKKSNYWSILQLEAEKRKERWRMRKKIWCLMKYILKNTHNHTDTHTFLSRHSNQHWLKSAAAVAPAWDDRKVLLILYIHVNVSERGDSFQKIIPAQPSVLKWKREKIHELKKSWKVTRQSLQKKGGEQKHMQLYIVINLYI